MVNKIIKIIPVIFLSAILCSAKNALSCSCAEPPPPKEALNKYSTVFVGKVIDGEVIKDKGYYVGRKFIFKISEIIKGNIKDTVEIYTGLGGGDCGYDFIIGRTYLIYASYYGEETQYKYSTNICSRTKEYHPDGKKEIEELKK